MLYYQLRNGKIVDEYDVYKAYEIATGNTFEYDSADFAKWLHSMLGNSIVEVIKETEIDIVRLIKGGNILAAVRTYRNMHDCTLREAKEKVEEMRKAEVKRK